ncbi:energy-coupling factor ABC transporter permease [Candidatus Micrarchaeota archaeon]|nr:energy-coupling factor ABC transporter permease [Candidatus Micrarchaeota archaeon]
MHTPDGFLTDGICLLMIFISAVPLALAIKNVRKNRPAIAPIATVAAIIFLAQMFNFPIESGTSGHLIGATFALLILGIDGAIIAMASVLLVQTLVFGDGGLFAVGANIFNMGVVGIYSSHFIMQWTTVKRHVRIFIASVLSVLAAASAVSIQLALSGTVVFSMVVPAMLFTHSMIGIGEGFLTILLVSIFSNRLRIPGIRTALGLSGMAFLALAAIIPFASDNPDGLEKIAIDYGFFESQTLFYSAPIPEYSVPLIASAWIATVSAAAIGAILSFMLPYSTLAIRG